MFLNGVGALPIVTAIRRNRCFGVVRRLGLGGHRGRHGLGAVVRRVGLGGLRVRHGRGLGVVAITAFISTIVTLGVRRSSTFFNFAGRDGGRAGGVKTRLRRWRGNVFFVKGRNHSMWDSCTERSDKTDLG